MKLPERDYIFRALLPLLPEGATLQHAGAALVYRPPEWWQRGGHNRELWYVGCPSYLGYVPGRTIGQLDQAPGWKEGLLCYTERFRATKRGEGGTEELIAAFRRLVLSEPESTSAWRGDPS